ncbi:Probable endonuclease 4 [Anaerotruncus sp. 2789STDY5834896]|uniref:Probable endonuclease 4 n=1 Tax=uncultured Anaerotruncus sp. TaxID=905011 RepID=A0A1C6HPR7_9FIRM|nr:Probable endonuclease 4 [uncultured Anaerotruncus sp.]
MPDTARFGPAGNSNSFKEQGYKTTLQAPGYVEKMGLDCYEYQCGRGVRVNPDTAEKFRRKAAEHRVAVSLHAPYYISLSSVEEEKRQKSVDYILQSARAADMLGASRIVVHTGSCAKISRAEALELAKGTIQTALDALDAAGLGHIHICPETMGKLNQLGTLEEVLALCRLDSRLIPCIDFGHLYARTLGGIAGKDDFRRILDAIGSVLGEEKLRDFHAHYSMIEYTENGGEKRHLTFADGLFGPDFHPLMELLAEYGSCPTIICESAGTQAEDALAMKTYYHQQLLKI